MNHPNTFETKLNVRSLDNKFKSCDQVLQGYQLKGWDSKDDLKLIWVIPCQVSHLMDGMFTDFAEILHTIWDMKKNPRTRRWAFWDLRGRRYGSGKFPIFRDFEDGLYISNGSNFFVFEDSSKKFSVLNR